MCGKHLSILYNKLVHDQDGQGLFRNTWGPFTNID